MGRGRDCHPWLLSLSLRCRLTQLNLPGRAFLDVVEIGFALFAEVIFWSCRFLLYANTAAMLPDLARVALYKKAGLL
jgi:hypothetical protein